MRVLHYAIRTVAPVALVALAAGCGGGDPTAPDAPFDPAGTSSDISAVSESFDSPALTAYSSVSGEISAVVGGSLAAAVRSAPTASLFSGGKSGALRFARTLSQGYTSNGGLRPSFSAVAAASIPAEYLGVTFVWDVETDQYVASEEGGAPANGVRFDLYAINPVTQLPIEPLVPIGYADITSSETSTSSTVRVIVVSSDVTYLDYAVTATGTMSSAVVGISGYATNGTDRVDFDLDTRLTSSEVAGIGLQLDYEMVVPSRGGFLLDLEAVIAGLDTETPSTTLDLLARGDHGTVSIEGSQTDANGSFDVRVNGDLFATITMDGTGTSEITGAGGQPLTADEQDALESVFGLFANGFDWFEDLTDPIA